MKKHLCRNPFVWSSRDDIVFEFLAMHCGIERGDETQENFKGIINNMS